MAYESPISVWWSDTKIEQLRDEYDNLIIRAVKNVCPQVDKDELIKALQYDRCQYEKGFADGLAFKPPVKSHGDSIRAMTDEELANWIADDLIEPGYNSREQTVKMWLNWLKQEADNE